MELGPNDVDRFYGLPENLLSHISSFLPMEDNIQTVRLSKTSKKFWKKNTTLDFSQAWSQKPHDEYIQSITETLPMLEIEKIMKFWVKFYYNRGDVNEVDQWIQFSVEKKVQQLKFVNKTIVWEEQEDHMYQLLRYVFQNEFLTELHLRGCELNLPTNIQVKALKTLHLNTLSLESDLVEKISSGCPFLESVVLKSCNYWKDLNVLIENPNVKRTKEYQLKNISFVIHARFSFEFHLTEVVSYGLVIMLRRIIEKFANVETLQLCSLCIQVLLDGDANRRLESSSPKNKELSLEELRKRDCSLDISFGRLTILHINTGFSKWESYRVVRLLRASPNLETLILNIDKKIELNEHSEYQEELLT